MARLIRRLQRVWWAIFLPGVMDDAELMELLAITTADLGAIRTEADARHRPGHHGAYFMDTRGHRQWQLRRALPIACRTLRGLR
jgi:hypothetical protein